MSAAMGGRLQCDFSHATFHIDNKLVKIYREWKSVYMIEQRIDDDTTLFLDTDINYFREKF